MATRRAWFDRRNLQYPAHGNQPFVVAALAGRCTQIYSIIEREKWISPRVRKQLAHPRRFSPALLLILKGTRPPIYQAAPTLELRRRAVNIRASGRTALG